jgi:NAD(P)-dependent dehydrogenase (short-subunit alcohol dehydrogenase family)
LSATIHETAELVTAAGGKGIAVPVDHGDDEQTKALFEQVAHEQGRLDILINNAAIIRDEMMGRTRFWEEPVNVIDILDVGLRMLDIAETPELTGHLIWALFNDPNLLDKTGQTLIGAELASNTASRMRAAGSSRHTATSTASTRGGNSTASCGEEVRQAGGVHATGNRLMPWRKAECRSDGSSTATMSGT